MKISVFKKCLCLELETGGKILGWLGIISGILMILFGSIVLITVSLMSCKELREILQDDDFHDLLSEVSITECQIFKPFLIFASIFVLVYNIISIIINILLLLGIKKRDPGKIIPAVIIQGFATFTIVFRGIASISREGIFCAVLFGSIAYFIFMILYSLYVKIRNDCAPRYENQIIQICKS
ncbi:uncharacterized protein [Chironomus tepperi]|uniref:uncharacterized protein n=1 Tax=Chironomus tepperi TaxID=113505 RepID=UPI00391F8F84